MGNSARVLALFVFGVIAIAFLIFTRAQAPSTELSVIRALLTEWDAQFASESSDPFAVAVFISSPTDCYFTESSDFPSQAHFQAFSGANGEGASPIRLGSLTDLVSVVSLQDAKRWQGNTHDINVGGRTIMEVSRVGFAGSEAIICINGRGVRMLYLLRNIDGRWQDIEEVARWIA